MRCAAFFVAGLASVLGWTGAAYGAKRTVAPGENLAELIAQATPGDHLQLKPGRHNGGLLLDRPLRLSGMPGAEIDGGGKGSVIIVDGPDVQIEGLRIVGSGTSHETIDSGVKLTENATGAVVINNHLEGNLHGVDIHGARNALVSKNTIVGSLNARMNSRGNGVYVWNAPGSQVVGNTIRYGRDGIFVNTSRNNSFRENRFENLRFAVHYMYADASEVIANHSQDNHLGYAIMFSTDVKVIDNVSVR
ncbi:MAG: NosD domain-containing protein, partial [Roseobacter sp.]|nr:NosD domain-containing protein [Roseobacter sp.]